MVCLAFQFYNQGNPGSYLCLNSAAIVDQPLAIQAVKLPAGLHVSRHLRIAVLILLLLINFRNQCPNSIMVKYSVCFNILLIIETKDSTTISAFLGYSKLKSSSRKIFWRGQLDMYIFHVVRFWCLTKFGCSDSVEHLSSQVSDLLMQCLVGFFFEGCLHMTASF